MVGLVSTPATWGSDSSARTLVRRLAHSSTFRSSSASWKTAFAYRLAAAVATRDLRPPGSYFQRQQLIHGRSLLPTPRNLRFRGDPGLVLPPTTTYPWPLTSAIARSISCLC